MKTTRFTTFFVALLGLFLLLPAASGMHVVPMPKEIAVGNSQLTIGKRIAFQLPDEKPQWKMHLDALSMLFKQSGIEFALSEIEGQSADATVVKVQYDEALANEEYRLSVKDTAIVIRSATLKGLCHATATLTQMLMTSKKTLSCCEISDAPDCSYRNLMIDLGRNPHSYECLRETIDLLWFYKIDSLQLHLTDDQRFAFPSKAFPKLWTERGGISWDQFVELERYAVARGVTLIPELEVPGHSTILRREYPETFGTSSTETAKLPQSRVAMRTLFDEMMEVFSSTPYVHIGGDEAFGVPVDLQRELINELHAFLKTKGKQTLVWEGPPPGKGDNRVHEDVIHLNWRTINYPADKMLANGHRVINAAWDPLYLVDHYPRNNFTMASPRHIYNNLKLERFRHFNPGIPTFGKPIEVEPSSQLIGFCMPWWEGREENYFHLMTPRIIPLAEVAWAPKRVRDAVPFEQRVQAIEAARQRLFCPITLTATSLILKQEGVFAGSTTLTLSSAVDGEIHFTRDGSPPTLKSQKYESPFAIEKSTLVRAVAFVDGQQQGFGLRRKFTLVEPTPNLALNKPVTASVSSGPWFTPARMTDGGTGPLDYFLGYPAKPKPIEIVVDLGNVATAKRIVIHSFTNGRAWESYRVDVSEDGKSFLTVADRQQRPEKPTGREEYEFSARKIRYVRLLTNGCQDNVFDSFSRITEIEVFE